MQPLSDPLLPPVAPTLHQVISYLQSHPQLLSQQLSLYTPQKIMMLLQHHNLDLLKSQFQSHGERGITLKSFLWLMTNTIPHKPTDRYELLYWLTRLFKQIDIDGNEHLSWTQFITYIIEAVKEYSVKVENYVGGGDQKQILQNAHAGESKTYRLSEQVKDLTVDRGSMIKQTQFVKEIGVVLCLEEDRGFVRVYDTELREKQADRIHIGVGWQQHIVAFAFGEDTLVVIGSLKEIAFYGYQRRKFELIAKTSVLAQPVSLYYLPLHKMFVTCDSEFKVRELKKPPRRRDDKVPECISFKAHDNQITCVNELENPFCVVTSSMDGTVKLWDFKQKKRLIIELKDPHIDQVTRGVKGFDIGYSNTIASWGFENYINVWAPEYSIVRPYAGQLKSNGMIIDAKCVKDSTTLISFDNKNTIRIWDQRRMLCLQSLVTQPSNLGIVIVNDGFIMHGRRMTLYELVKDNNSQEQMRKLASVPKQVFFNFFYGIFVIMTPTQLRIHNAKTGHLTAVHNLIFESKHDNYLTSFCRASDRKVYLGNSEGSINLVNIKSGAALKNVHVADKEDTCVNKMFFFNQQHILVAASSKLESFDEVLLDDAIVKTIRVGEIEQISELSFSEELLVFVTTFQNKFCLWSFESFKLYTAQLVEDYIVAIQFIPGYYGVVVATEKYIELYSIDTSFLQITLECKMHNLKLPEDQSLTSLLAINVNSLLDNVSGAMHQVRQTLQSGQITVNLNDFEEKILEVSKQSSAIKERMNLIVGNSSGYIYLMDFTPFIIASNLRPILQRRNIRFFEFKRKQYQLFKMHLLYNSLGVTNNIISHFQHFSFILPAHHDSISNITNMPQIQSFCTCSNDNSVKIFKSSNGQLLCHLQLHTLQLKKWKLPPKLWIEERLKQFSLVLGLAKEIGEGRKEKETEEEIKAKFLMGLFLNKDQKQAFLATLRPPGDKKQVRIVKQKNQIRRRITDEQIDRQKAELQQSMKIRYRSVTLNRAATKEQSTNKKVSDTSINLANDFIEEKKQQKPIIRVRSNTNLSKKKNYEARPIISATKDGFLSNLRSASKLLTISKETKNNIKHQIVRDTIFREGQGSRLLRSATKMTISNFYSQSQKSTLMNQGLFQRMDGIFKAIAEVGSKKYKK